MKKNLKFSLNLIINKRSINKINVPKFILHLTKRNKISEANQKKNKNKKETMEDLEDDNLIFPKQINLNNYIKNDNNENGNIEDNDDIDFNKDENDNNEIIPFDQLI